MTRLHGFRWLGLVLVALAPVGCDSTGQPDNPDGGPTASPDSADAGSQTGVGSPAASEAGVVDNGTVAIVPMQIDVEQPWVVAQNACTVPDGGLAGPHPADGDHWTTTDGALLYQPPYPGQTPYGSIRTCEGDREWAFKDQTAATHRWTIADDSMFQAWARTDPMTQLSFLTTARDTASGDRVWEDSFATSMTVPQINVIEARGDHLYVTGTSGQLPGKPPVASTTTPYTAHYSTATGKQDWLRQEEANELKLNGSSVRAADIDDDGNIYEMFITGSIGATFKIQKLNTKGERVWLSAIAFSAARGLQGMGQLSLNASADGQAVFLFSGEFIAKLDGRGRHEWSKSVTTSHSVVIDEVEQTTWSGMGGNRFVTASRDAVYLVGEYLNQYKLGSNPPPSFNSTVVVKFDYAGKLQWAKQYRLGPLDVGPGKSGSAAGSAAISVRATGKGDLALTVVTTEMNPAARRVASIHISPNGAVP